MADRLVWERDGGDWPNRAASRFETCGGLRWHVQVIDASPVEPVEPVSGDTLSGTSAGTSARPATLHPSSRPAVLLIHGTGASTHSWAGMAPLLALHYTVVAVDLPGHAFTATPPVSQMSLPGMAQALGRLMAQLGIEPQLVIGHSAGAAIAVRLCLDAYIAPHTVVSLNGAFLPIGGLAGPLFLPVARLLAGSRLVPKLFSWQAAKPAVLQRLIEATGSRLDAQGVALYGRLVRSEAHAAGALQMMANWDLRPLQHDLPLLRPALRLVVGERDLTVPPRQAREIRALLPQASINLLPGLGHLAHEEQPAQVAQRVLALAALGRRVADSKSTD